MSEIENMTPRELTEHIQSFPNDRGSLKLILIKIISELESLQVQIEEMRNE